MGIKKLYSRKNSLKSILSIYSLIFIAIIGFLFLLLYIGFNYGVKYDLYTFANHEEKQVESLKQKIISSQSFNPTWVPSNIGYIQLNQENKIIQSNMTPKNKKNALAYLKGKQTSSKDYFLKVVYKDGICIFKYNIGVFYSSDWANAHLPSVELLFLLIIALIIFIPTMWFAKSITKRIYKDVFPLQNALIAIGQGDLTIPVPTLTISEFKELGSLTEHMRIDLKATLEALWSSEHKIREQTTQMLHDYRSPLTVARANAEFMKEDLNQLNKASSDNEKEQLYSSLVTYTESIIFNLNRLSEVADRLQRQFSNEDAVKEPLAFNQFNRKIEQEGQMLSKHYGNKWKSQFHKTGAYTMIEESTLYQALTNIILNACEHGRSPQSINLSFMVTNEKAEYKVINSGSCFSNAALTHATDKGFSESQNHLQTIKGMGLYFVANVLRANGGELYLSNTPEGYACVQIILPSYEPKKNT
ncbi:HAMP domain-containing sensor histidine kinase [Enterococcus columbae]|uniref:histidine kinase n=1 Tax=Enterococcus columbae DSM 7374 = ATCC 51263 TaxID=1121865 RepID=S0KW88_9ENTE|nr:HAMP domain-containing sensor histidine kinase [Enterococcus columbae]EOT44368.1 hypothetical protein OMW_00424 [Enterococcus columbae DSM 7374 = ATCC 51263]EOW84526.1 hypothetical protein I568_01022 [Enterococcus columbae DSM 7374 = ATCC 51263]